MNELRNKRILLTAMSAFLLLASVDLCQYGQDVRGRPAACPDVEAATPGTIWGALECADACHGSVPCTASSGHCTFCPCFCHVSGILIAGANPLHGSSSPERLVEPTVARISEFPSEIDHPPLPS